MVVVNGPGILASPQAAVMASYVDAILLVLVAGQTGTREAREALRLLDLAGGKIMGVTLLTL
jgi:Mrp family chromosome partitioning ATPase